jgi:hypothetical protein
MISQEAALRLWEKVDGSLAGRRKVQGTTMLFLKDYTKSTPNAPQKKKKKRLDLFYFLGDGRLIVQSANV